MRPLRSKLTESMMERKQVTSSNSSSSPVPETPGEARRAAIACGLWMRAGFVGASVFATGVVSLANDGAQAVGLPLTLSALVVGGATARFCWRKVALAIQRIDASARTEPAVAAASTRPVADRRPTVLATR
jgi:hypothetical protein